MFRKLKAIIAKIKINRAVKNNIIPSNLRQLQRDIKKGGLR